MREVYKVVKRREYDDRMEWWSLYNTPMSKQYLLQRKGESLGLPMSHRSDLYPFFVFVDLAYAKAYVERESQAGGIEGDLWDVFRCTTTAVSYVSSVPTLVAISQLVNPRSFLKDYWYAVRTCNAELLPEIRQVGVMAGTGLVYDITFEGRV